MASVTKQDDGNNAMADEKSTADEEGSALVRKGKGEATSRAESGGTEVARLSGGSSSRKSEPGFFTIYKSGQGYWTRMGTVGGAGIIAVLTAQFLYDQARVWFKDSTGHTRQSMVLGLVFAFLAIFALIVYRITNRPKVVEFLIATDAEMKKVNWTSRKELIGSTKVVIVFMILIATILFVFDTVFAQVFHWIGVLLVGPFDR
jgi:preprotein translocase subunit SecE